MHDTTPVTLTILGKDYRVACPPGEDVALHEAATYLDAKMQEIRNTGRVIGVDRIAVMAALNITHDLLGQTPHQASEDAVLTHQVQALTHKISDQLQRSTLPSKTDQPSD